MISEMANTPCEVSLGGKKYLVSRMPIAELYGPSEAHVLSEYKSNMLSIASSLQGKEKMQYLTEATKDIPKGSALMEAAQEYLGTPEGYFKLLISALSKHQNVTETEVMDGLSKSTEEEKAMLISHLMGTDFDTARASLSTAEEDVKKKLI